MAKEENILRIRSNLYASEDKDMRNISILKKIKPKTTYFPELF